MRRELYLMVVYVYAAEMWGENTDYMLDRGFTCNTIHSTRVALS
jgi:hypothetical protein